MARKSKCPTIKFRKKPNCSIWECKQFKIKLSKNDFNENCYYLYDMSLDKGYNAIGGFISLKEAKKYANIINRVDNLHK